MFEKYKKLIELKIEREELTEEFIVKITNQLDYYLQKKKLTQEEYNDLIQLMHPNTEEE